MRSRQLALLAEQMGRTLNSAERLRDDLDELRSHLEQVEWTRNDACPDAEQAIGHLVILLALQQCIVRKVSSEPLDD